MRFGTRHIDAASKVNDAIRGFQQGGSMKFKCPLCGKLSGHQIVQIDELSMTGTIHCDRTGKSYQFNCVPTGGSKSARTEKDSKAAHKGSGSSKPRRK